MLSGRIGTSRFETDAAAGRLDHLVREVEADIAAGRVKPLDESLTTPKKLSGKIHPR